MITIKNLSKRYGEILAVDDLTFRVEPGEVLGFLGANGAGKSTTMRMIAGFISPTAGEITVCGHDIEQAPVAAKSCIGYLPEGAPSYGEMTVAEFLDFIADVRGLAGERRRERRAVVVDRLALAPVIDQVIETLSKGFRRRVGLAQALDPRPAGADPGRAHRRPRSQSKARGSAPHQRAQQGQAGDRIHPHSGGGARGVHTRHHHLRTGASWPMSRRPPSRRARAITTP